MHAQNAPEFFCGDVQKFSWGVCPSLRPFYTVAVATRLPILALSHPPTPKHTRKRLDLESSFQLIMISFFEILGLECTHDFDIIFYFCNVVLKLASQCTPHFILLPIPLILMYTSAWRVTHHTCRSLMTIWYGTYILNTCMYVHIIFPISSTCTCTI